MGTRLGTLIAMNPTWESIRDRIARTPLAAPGKLSHWHEGLENKLLLIWQYFFVWDPPGAQTASDILQTEYFTMAAMCAEHLNEVSKSRPRAIPCDS